MMLGCAAHRLTLQEPVVGVGHLGWVAVRWVQWNSIVLYDTQTSKVEQLLPTAAEKSKYILEE